MKKILKYLIILGILQSNSNASSEPPSAASVDISDGLVAHYPFSGDSNDQSGNDHHLENRGATLTSDRFGMKDSAYAFDGKASHLFADIEDRKGDFSISLWAKANDVEQSRYRSVINIHDKTPGSKDTCQIHTSGGRYPTYQFFSSNPESFALVTPKWQHLAVSVSGKVIRFYENGEKVYSQELEGGEANQFSNIIIGKNRHGGRKYNGNIDDVYVYNRAINDAEVARLFDGGFEDSDGDGLTDAYEVGYRENATGIDLLRYQIVSDKNYSFDEAAAKAVEMGGHLATIVSAAENTSIMNAFGGSLPETVWIGGTDEKTEGTWGWITGELWKFSNWKDVQTTYADLAGGEQPDEINDPFDWKIVKGNWRLDQDGSMHILERIPGAVAWIGERDWENYTFSTQIKIENRADAGIIFRTTEVSPHNNHGKHYYVGLYPQKNRVVLGHMNGRWNVLKQANFPIEPDQNYELSMTLLENRIVVSINRKVVIEGDWNINPVGSFGLRSYNALASYSDFHIDLHAEGETVNHSELTFGDYSKMYESGAWYDWRNDSQKESFLLEFGYYTNPNLADSDGDGHDDGKEVAANTDPNNPLSRPMPFMQPPSKAPGAPPAPDYVDTITKLTAALQEKTAQLAAHEEKDARRSKELTEANANNAELVAKVESLEAEVTSLNGQVASLTTENGELKGQVTNLREDNGNLQLNVTSLNEQLVESDRIAKTPFVHDWVYTPDHGWLYIDPKNFPIIYKNDTQTWHFYEQGSINPRYFYNFNEQKWEAWDPIE